MFFKQLITQFPIFLPIHIYCHCALGHVRGPAFHQEAVLRERVGGTQELRPLSCSIFMILIIVVGSQSQASHFVLIYFIDYAVKVVPIFLPFPPWAWYPLPFRHPLPRPSSCSQVVRLSSLASPLPMLFLTFPCLFCCYLLCFLIPVPFPPLFPCPLPAVSPPNDLYTYDSVPVQVVGLGCFCFCFVFQIQLLIVVSLL